jgi:hypothetical protein
LGYRRSEVHVDQGRQKKNIRLERVKKLENVSDTGMHEGNIGGHSSQKIEFSAFTSSALFLQ